VFPETESANILKIPAEHEAGAVNKLLAVRAHPGEAEKLAVTFTVAPFAFNPVSVTVCGLLVMAKL
jgi:hypothetical protein